MSRLDDIPVRQHLGSTTDYRYGCRCADCRQAMRSYEATHREAHREQDRAKDARYRAAHPDRRREQHRAYYVANLEQVHLRAAAYRAAHLDRLREYKAAWWASHPAKSKVYRSAEYAAYPERFRAQEFRRRALLAGAEFEVFTLVDVVARDGWGCGICGEQVDPEAKGRTGKSLDHVIALSRGGPHTLTNAQLAHVGCNSSKGADRPTWRAALAGRAVR